MDGDGALAIYRMRTATKHLDEILDEVRDEQELFMILVTMLSMHMAKEYDMSRRDFDGLADHLYNTYCAIRSAL